MEKTAKIISRTVCVLISAAAVMISCFGAMLPNEICVEAGAVSGGFYVAELKIQDNGQISYCIGGIPIKNVSATAVERPMLIPCGTPFGIKLKTDGVMAVAIKEDSPAADAGIREGDMIRSVNGQIVTSNSGLSSAVQLSPQQCEIIIKRGDSEKRLMLTPYLDCGLYKIGVWVRDSAAGLGTMSYYDPETGCYGGLGHPVSDVTTGELMPLKSGEITNASITDVIIGEAGTPGELCGTLISGETIGTLEKNTECGIFGTAESCPATGTPIPMAFRQEVRTGDAYILTTIDGQTPQKYDIEIEHINLIDMERSKSMVIRITDKELLEKTGGIVCGMSGSPIIQDGRLVGAITHVFLNDPEKGYAIFCETMLNEAA